VAARDWAVETLDVVDGNRAGILGWSHGGLIALLAVFDHPDKFRAAYAGVPVWDSSNGFTRTRPEVTASIGWTRNSPGSPEGRSGRS
jgi:dipeptidyl aminopeptidase/acylaminoacyl peptidase